jgi:hypothetical protein
VIHKNNAARRKGRLMKKLVHSYPLNQARLRRRRPPRSRSSSEDSCESGSRETPAFVTPTRPPLFSDELRKIGEGRGGLI